MFDKFGEFDSVEELNRAAAGFKEEGDIESLKELAKENGIDKFDVEDYCDGEIETLATELSAAVGRLEIEEDDIKSAEDAIERLPCLVILEMTNSMLEEDEDLRRAVIKKGKRIKDIFTEMKLEASRKRSGNVGISCGTDRQLKKIIKTYYRGTKDELKNELESLYR